MPTVPQIRRIKLVTFIYTRFYVELELIRSHFRQEIFQEGSCRLTGSPTK